MARKNISIIVGDGACGKSSLVRALTGVYQGGIRWVRTTNPVADKEFSIYVRSAQEAGRTPQEVESIIANCGVDHVLMTLRQDHYNGINFTAQEYIIHLMKSFNIVAVVFMSQGTATTFNVPGAITNRINDSHSRPVNANAHMVRVWWNWE